MNVASTLLLSQTLASAFVVTGTNACPRGGMSSSRKDTHVDTEFSDQRHRNYSIDTGDGHQPRNNGTMRPDCFFNLGIDHDDVRFNLLNASELDVEHEPMVSLNVAAQREDKCVQFCAEPPFSKLRHLFRILLTFYECT